MQKLGWLIPILGVLGIGLQGQALAQSGEPSSQASATKDYTFITFEAPDAGTSAGQGTYPSGINRKGSIAGYYTDAKNVFHGFVRLRDCDSEDRDWRCVGTVKTFDVPDAGTGAYQGTSPAAINDTGTITGYYTDEHNVAHGFVRFRDCDARDHDRNCGPAITTFDVPGAGTGASQGVYPDAINDKGRITGYYIDADGAYHGFVRVGKCGSDDPNWNCGATIITFDVPSGPYGESQGTQPHAINEEGTITGYYTDANDVSHGFLRLRNGTFITFDAPDAGTASFQGTFAFAINAKGEITGYSIEPYYAEYVLAHGFLRSRDGAFTTFYVPNTGTPFTEPLAINTEGAITGDYFDSNNASHGFVRSSHGTITAFDVPDAGEGNLQGTFPVGINQANTITGYSIDANNVAYGFLGIPKREESWR